MIAARYSGSSTFNRTKRSVFLLLSNDFRLMDFDVEPSWASSRAQTGDRWAGEKWLFAFVEKWRRVVSTMTDEFCVYLQMVNNSVDCVGIWHALRARNNQIHYWPFSYFRLSRGDNLPFIMVSSVGAHKSWAKNYSLTWLIAIMPNIIKIVRNFDDGLPTA